MYNCHYLVDTKLIAYWLVQRGSTITELYNKIAEIIWAYPKGKIYLAFDDGKSAYRTALYTAYKGHRAKARAKKSPEEILQHQQFERDYLKLIELSKHLPVTVLHSYGVEADDLISIMVERLKGDETNKVYMVTGDFDYVNSVVNTDNVAIINVNGGALVNDEFVREKYGALLSTRERFNVHKSIYGDPSDNIKFMRNFGKVKADDVFPRLYENYETPTVDEIAYEVREYIKPYKSIKIHENHIKDGRTTIEEVLETNLKLADTFRDTSKMCASQVTQFENTLALPKVEVISTPELFDASLEIMQSMITVSPMAERVFNIR